MRTNKTKVRREPRNNQKRMNMNRVLGEIANFFRLGKTEKANLKAALTTNARSAKQSLKSYAAKFWTLLTQLGGLGKLQKSQVLQGNIFAFA